jgi:hypothetical protein
MSMTCRTLLFGPLALVVLISAAPFLSAAEVPKAPVPKSPYLPVIYRYADTMLKNGRDAYGPQKTALFLSALDRATLAPLTNFPNAPTGIGSGERVGGTNQPLVGANPQHDQNFLRLLYTLSELSGKPHYREAADAELKWFLENARSPVTQLLPWGTYLSWDVMKDQPMTHNTADSGAHRFFRPWMLWDRCFALASEGSRRFARGLWEHQISNHTNGGFNDFAGFFQHQTADAFDRPNHAGFYIRTWAAAFAHTKDEQFLHAIDVLLTRYEKKRDATTGWFPVYNFVTNAEVAATLSLTIDCDGAAHQVPEPLAARLRRFASRNDELVCGLPQDVRKNGGFNTHVLPRTGRPFSGYTVLWKANPVYGVHSGTTAQVGMMCVSRYDNTGKVGYRDLILGAADAYLDSLPAEDMDAWPVTFGHAISLQLAAWRHSADWKYMERARKFGDIAVEKFWGTNALPKASYATDHYETITGADTLALALIELHLNVLHITAVRCPPNTIDR